MAHGVCERSRWHNGSSDQRKAAERQWKIKERHRKEFERARSTTRRTGRPRRHIAGRAPTRHAEKGDAAVRISLQSLCSSSFAPTHFKKVLLAAGIARTKQQHLLSFPLSQASSLLPSPPPSRPLFSPLSSPLFFLPSNPFTHPDTAKRTQSRDDATSQHRSV